MFAVILDHRPPYLSSQSDGPSLLMLPLGTSSLLDQAVNRLVAAGDSEVFVHPVFDIDREYETRIQRHTVFGVKVVRHGELSALVAARDGMERVVILDSMWWPAEEMDWGLVFSAGETFGGARHVVGMGSKRESSRERVDCDPDGTIRQVRRVFERIPWSGNSGSAVMMSITPCGVLERMTFGSLSEFRSKLGPIGVLSRDEPVACESWDLRTEQGMLVAMERAMAEVGTGQAAMGFRSIGLGVLAAEEVTVDPTAKLVGPVLLFPRSRVDAGATIVGPTIVGTDARVEHGAVVAQSLLATKAVIRARAIVHGRVVSGLVLGAGHESTLGNLSTYTAPEHYVVAEGEIGARPSWASRRRSVHALIKRVVDIAAAALGLAVLSPLLLVLIILIKLDSSGPVFFGHRRERNEGREFLCLKFRTMVPDADCLQKVLAAKNEVDGPQFKIQNDPRVTRIGRFLRASNLDEIPQLWNVLRGQMSLVGPRPSPFRENQICVPWRQARLSVRPGITGLWQVCRGNREQSDFNQWIYYDIMYVRNFSIWLDAKILVATLLTLGGKWSVPLSWLVPANGRPYGANAVPAL